MCVCGVLLGVHKPIDRCYCMYRCVLIAAVTPIIETVGYAVVIKEAVL